MTAPVRHPATDITLFDVGGVHMIAEFENGTIVFNTKDEDASGAKDINTYPWGVKTDWHIEVDLFVADAAALMAVAGTSVPATFTTGAGSYSGNVLVTMANHQVKGSSLQKSKGMLKGQGPCTVA